jgi:hypothetical protein
MKISYKPIKFMRLLLILFLAVSIIGCDAFTRKFTRKKKKVDTQEELVLAPEEYKGPEIPKEDLYRRYLCYWQSWQDELIKALLENNSHKKQVDCANEALKQLANMRKMLKEAKQKQFDLQMKELAILKNDIDQDHYGRNSVYHKRQAEKIRRNILQDFSRTDVKNDLI